MLHIGVIAHSIEPAADCIRGISPTAGRRMGPSLHPEISLARAPPERPARYCLGATRRPDSRLTGRVVRASISAF